MQHGPAGIAATPTEPKHLGTRLHRWNHAKPAPSHDPPSGYHVATNECAASQGRGHRRVASVKSWPAPNERCEYPLFALWHVASERRSKERRHAMGASIRRCQGYHCRVPSLNQSEMQAVSANYGSDTTLVNVLGPVPGVDVMAKRSQGLLNVGTLSARMAVLRSCALDI